MKALYVEEKTTTLKHFVCGKKEDRDDDFRGIFILRNRHHRGKGVPRAMESVVEICDGAFKNCENLTEITIPDSVDRIDDFAFSDCTSLKRVEFLAEPSYIGKKVFDGCTHLEIIYCPRHLGEGFMFNGEYYGLAVGTSIGFTDGFESH